MLGRSERVPCAILTGTGTGVFWKMEGHTNNERDSSIANSPGPAGKDNIGRGKETASLRCITPESFPLDDASDKVLGDRPPRHGKKRVSFILRPCCLLPFCPRAILKLHPTLCAEEEDKEEDDRKGSQKGATEHYYDVRARKAPIVNWGEETLPVW